MHREAVNEEGRNLLPFFRKIDDFYLAGGTALALQLGHRISIDFDFFSNTPIKPALLPELERLFKNKKLNVSVNNADELTLFIDSVKVTFLFYPFPLLLQLHDFEGIKLAASEEIAAMKAYTIGRRGSFKDYIDLYFILFDKIDTLDGIIKNSEKKYSEVFNSRLFLEQLVYFKDIKDTEITFLREEVDEKELQRFFEDKVKEIKL